MTQPTLTDLAQRGAACKLWAEWCHHMYAMGHNGPFVQEYWRDDLVVLKKEWQDHFIGPLPSCTYLDDQLGEFFRLAGVTYDPTSNFYRLGCRQFSMPELHGPLDRLELAITIVERAHRLGANMHLSETEAAPYMAAFLRGIGK